jgi:hypothetical protein
MDLPWAVLPPCITGHFISFIVFAPFVLLSVEDGPCHRCQNVDHVSLLGVVIGMF